MYSKFEVESGSSGPVLGMSSDEVAFIIKISNLTGLVGIKELRSNLDSGLKQYGLYKIFDTSKYLEGGSYITIEIYFTVIFLIFVVMKTLKDYSMYKYDHRDEQFGKFLFLLDIGLKEHLRDEKLEDILE